MKNLQVEAIFGGVIVLLVVGVVLFAVANTKLGTGAGNILASANGGATSVGPASDGVVRPKARAISFNASGGQDLICECYDKAFSLASKKDVLSPDYRTGFVQCRARGGVDGGNAWTSGWQARKSARPYESSCRAYKKSL